MNEYPVENDDGFIEEFLSDSSMENVEELHVRKKKLNPVAISFYGKSFEKFSLMEEIKDLVPIFKGFYYEKKMKEPKLSAIKIIQEFNTLHVFPQGRVFHPYMQNFTRWRKQWDWDISNQIRENKELLKPQPVRQIVQTRDSEDRVLRGLTEHKDLESGINTLGGELLNDAFQMLKDDQAIGEVFDDEVLIKRRNYVAGVFGHVTKMVHGKAALLLKASQEKRENAGFLMDLLAKATSGKMSPEEMESLKTVYSAPPKAEVIHGS